MTATVNKYSKVLLLGDSLTQFSFSPEGLWGSLLAARLQRIADVVCRGLAGYNTRWYLKLLPQLLEGLEGESVSSVVLFLGANDSAHPDCPSSQHVPVEEYKDNLKKIVHILQERAIKKERIVIVNPPPYYHEDFLATKSDSDTKPRRSAEAAAEYSVACLQAANEIPVASVDIHSAFKADSRGSDLFCDGLHFSPAGSKLLFDTIWPSVGKKVMEFYATDSLDQMFPYWMEFASKRQDSINETTSSSDKK